MRIPVKKFVQEYSQVVCAVICLGAALGHLNLYDNGNGDGFVVHSHLE